MRPLTLTERKWLHLVPRYTFGKLYREVMDDIWDMEPALGLMGDAFGNMGYAEYAYLMLTYMAEECPRTGGNAFHAYDFYPGSAPRHFQPKEELKAHQTPKDISGFFYKDWIRNMEIVLVLPSKEVIIPREYGAGSYNDFTKVALLREYELKRVELDEGICKHWQFLNGVRR
ncbi:MAG: hypothetical protein KJ709_04480 [Nanoarchaeota archaeon]|nr:hypothetical protein [Nanoarchaeota archaeon]